MMITGSTARALVPSSARGPVALRPAFAFHGLIGRTPAMQQLFAALGRFAPHARATLVTGETGTGKSAVARTLYRLGPRRGGAFVTIACADLLAAGDAAWPAQAWDRIDGSADTTLYFDDVADLPASEQTRLAQRLAGGDVDKGRAAFDAHVIAATSHDLPAAIAAGRFRADLYYRLGVFTLHLPPLRERLGDLPELAAAFLREIAARLRLPVRGLLPSAVRALQMHPWPGNLRELHNVLERAAVLTDGDAVGESAVRIALAGAAYPAAEPVLRQADVPAHDPSSRLDDAQRLHVRGVLRDVHGNKTRAAARLGISRRALYRLLDRLGA